MHLVVGLGNPEREYAGTRHNLGFEVIDVLRERWGAPPYSKKFHGETSLADVGGRKVLLLKPQTYMNRSGLSVGEAASFFKIPPTQVIVLTDDLDTAPARLRVRLSGGAGGHNGLKSIIDSLGTQGFPRIRIGIGRPPKGPTDGYVLARIPKADEPLYREAIHLAAEAVEACVSSGVEKAMNVYNQKGEATK